MFGAHEYHTKADLAYEQVRHLILTGRLGPGHRLDQDWLASELGISRMPLRQAMLRLIAEGLVDAPPHRSAVVRELSPAELEDLYESRRAIEGMLAENGTTRCTTQDHRSMGQAIRDQERAIRDEDFGRFVEADREFHVRLFRATGYTNACEIAERLYDSTRRYVRVYADRIKGADRSLVEHRQILEHVRAGNAAQVRRHTEEHVRRGLESLRDAVAATDERVAG
jgi:DNA-binding GntR family transcriptional regulator